MNTNNITCLYDNCHICSALKEEEAAKQKIPLCLFALMLYNFSLLQHQPQPMQEECGTHETMNKETEEFPVEELIQSDIC
jgi:hypothetical protein